MTTTTPVPAYRLTAGDQTVASDDLPDLIDALIDGYAEMDDEVGLIARVDVLGLAVRAAQQSILDETDFDAPPSDEQLTALLRDKRDPLPSPLDAWDLDVPLLELATHFAPYTDAPAPAGAVDILDLDPDASVPPGTVVLCDPVDERAFLSCLHLFNLVEFTVAAS